MSFSGPSDGTRVAACTIQLDDSRLETDLVGAVHTIPPVGLDLDESISGARLLRGEIPASDALPERKPRPSKSR